MKLVEMKCKNCGAKLKVNAEAKDANCQFCGAEFKIDDEVQHVKYDDMEQAGYEFEKGKLKAQDEHQARNNQETRTYQQKKDNKTLWLVLGWIFLFPFMATYFIAKSNKLDTKKKIIIIVVMWIVFFIIGAISSAQNEEDKKNRIIECYSQETYDKLDELLGMDNIDGYFSDTYACDKLNLKNQHNKKIEIEMDGDNLISIKLDDKYIYHTDNTVDIYDPTTLRIKKKNTTEYYKDDESINLFINKYNRLFDPDITSDMISKKHIGGSDRDDVVTVSNDKLTINIYGSSPYIKEYKMSVYVGYKPQVESSNDDFKNQFVKYVKMFDESLSEDEIEKYWTDMISEYRSGYKIKEIEITPNVSNGKVSYFKIESKIKY